VSIDLPRELILGTLLNGAGHHEGGWRQEGSRAEEIYSLSLYTDLARQAERAKLHLVFMADSPSHSGSGIAIKAHRHLEPATLLSALAVQTSHIGLVGTFTTTYSEPYNIARQLNSLDIISNGRAGWNIVTSHSGAENFTNQPHPEHSWRYRKADEYVTLAKTLWNGWEDDAVVIDREKGIWVDVKKLHEANFSGEHFHVQGPLNLPASAQRWPVLVQAGASDDGKVLAAKHAELVYTAANDIKNAQAYYADLKGRLSAHGRMPNSLKVLFGVAPVIGDTEADAIRKLDELDELINFDAARGGLEKLLGNVDLSQIGLDEKIPESLLPETSQAWVESRYKLLRELAVDKGYTIRKLIKVAQRGGGHFSPVGSVEQVGDQLIEWFENGAADGFNFLPLSIPTGLNDITDKLVPYLQDRSYFRRDYREGTFRDNIGLPPIQRG